MLNMIAHDQFSFFHFQRKHFLKIFLPNNNEREIFYKNFQLQFVFTNLLQNRKKKRDK